MEKHTSFTHTCLRTIYRILIAGLCIVINAFRPILGPAECLFEERCTPYALRQLQEKALPIALWNIGTRLIMCSPLWYLYYNSSVARRLNSLRSLVSK